jgi:hypothetical protein
MPVIPAVWEMEVGRLRSKIKLGKHLRPYMKNKLKAKGPGLCLK